MTPGLASQDQWQPPENSRKPEQIYKQQAKLCSHSRNLQADTQTKWGVQWGEIVYFKPSRVIFISCTIQVMKEMHLLALFCVFTCMQVCMHPATKQNSMPLLWQSSRGFAPCLPPQRYVEFVLSLYVFVPLLHLGILPRPTLFSVFQNRKQIQKVPHSQAKESLNNTEGIFFSTITSPYDCANQITTVSCKAHLWCSHFTDGNWVQDTVAWA